MAHSGRATPISANSATTPATPATPNFVDKRSSSIRQLRFSRDAETVLKDGRMNGAMYLKDNGFNRYRV